MEYRVRGSTETDIGKEVWRPLAQRAARGSALTFALLLAFGCGEKPFASGPGNPSASGGADRNAAGGTGGRLDATGGGSVGGSTETGGRWTMGGAPGAGGQVGTGGVASTGGVTATGGTTAASCVPPRPTQAKNCGIASDASGRFSYSKWYRDYYSLYPYTGFAYVLISVTTNPSNSLLCYAEAFGPSTSALCGAGSVPADCSTNTVAVIGFNFNQVQWGGGTSENGYTQPTLPIAFPAPVKDVTVTFVNPANSDLRIQIAQDSSNGPQYYCYGIKGMTSPVTVASDRFTRTCWDSANPGAAWDGTDAESIALTIPSQRREPTPFDACLQNVELH